MLRALPPVEDIPADIGALIRVGRIDSVDLDAATCIVAFGDPDGDDGDVATSPVRWASARCGDTSVWLPPSVGEQVLFLCPDGELSAAIPIAAIPSDDHPPAGNTARALIRFADNGLFAYDPVAHRADITLPAGATLVIAATGGVTIDGPVQITGDVTVTGTLTASTDVIGGGKSLKSHTHPGVTSGSAQTGAPA